jgi:hypothetical protein
MTNHFMVKQASTLNVRMSHYSLDVYSTREYQRQSNLAYAWDVALDPVYLGILAESTAVDPKTQGCHRHVRLEAKRQTRPCGSQP